MLRLEDVKYKYGRISPYILNGVTYEFEKGTMYAVMGGSGAGKTTLMAVIARLDKPSSGTIFYNGKDVETINGDIYRAANVSTIFQSYNLLQNYTAIDNISTILSIIKYKGNYRERADELLREVGIPADKHKYVVQNLSGGEQQRVAIARTIAANSEVILADEPTGSLDADNSENIMRIFMSLVQKYNKCVIIVTHSDDVAKYADHILKIADGRITHDSTDAPQPTM